MAEWALHGKGLLSFFISLKHKNADLRLRAGARLRQAPLGPPLHGSGGHALVPRARAPRLRQQVRRGRRPLGGGLHLRRAPQHVAALRRRHGHEQLSLVIRALGTPTEANWPSLSQLPDYNKIEFPHYEPVPFDELCRTRAPRRGLLQRFLVYRSDRRVRAKDGLLHAYFYVPPLPCHHTDLPIPKRGKRVHNYEYDLDRPVRESIVDPDLFAKICLE